MTDAPDYFNSRQATRSLSGLPLNTTPMSLEPNSARPRTPATRISPYLNRVSPTTATFGSSYTSSLRRTQSRFGFYPGGMTSPLATPSSLREIYSDMNPSGVYSTANGHAPPIISNSTTYATIQGNVSQEGLPYTHSKRDSYASTTTMVQGHSPTMLSKLHRRESSSSPNYGFDKNERSTVRGGGFKMTRLNIGLFDSDET